MKKELTFRQKLIISVDYCEHATWRTTKGPLACLFQKEFKDLVESGVIKLRAQGSHLVGYPLSQEEKRSLFNKYKTRRENLRDLSEDGLHPEDFLPNLGKVETLFNSFMERKFIRTLKGQMISLGLFEYKERIESLLQRPLNFIEFNTLVKNKIKVELSLDPDQNIVKLKREYMMSA